MDNIGYSNEAIASAGVPFDNINWNNTPGQPFGTASKFNVIVFNDANNIIDIEGPVAIGGSFYSSRGLSVGFARGGNKAVSYSPDLVRFLVGGNVSMTGPLVVIGHVVVGGGFRADKGSTYLIGKGMNDEMQELKFLYQNNRGSQYWTPSDKGDHYVVPSYDVPRYIPASRIDADISGFFNDARESIENYKDCIEALTPNGIVVNNNYEWILRGNDPVQNIFLIDVTPNGLINKGIRAEVPQGSTVIVRLRTGANAHLQYGVYGERSKANRTLYVFEDASNIYMEKSSDIWGSILAPQAMFHAHPTGGHVSGNAALGNFAVNANSGFEFHYVPFVGEVICETITSPAVPTPVVPEPVIPTPVVPTPAVPTPVVPTPVVPTPVIPTPVVPTPAVPTPVIPTPAVPGPVVIAPEVPPVCPECPTLQPCPVAPPCPMCPECPVPEPWPPCPAPEPCPMCPECPTCPTPEPCPTCPTPEPCPTCPTPEPCPTCPIPEPCPICPECPTCPTPEPCPICPTCPECPTCTTPEPCPECPPCPVCPECLIQPGVIMGCIEGCCCNRFHDWDVKLYERCDGIDVFLCCVQVNGCGYFEFAVPFEGCYILKVRLSSNCCKTFRCKPIITLNNIGVESFVIE